MDYNDYKALLAMESSGHLNPAQKTQLEQARRSGSFNGGGGMGESGADRLLRETLEKYTKDLEAYNSRFNEFTTKNPFVFDEVLKEEVGKVKQRLDPYYNQIIGDYMQGVELKKSRSLEDERKLLGYLTQQTDKYNQEQKEILREGFDQISGEFSQQGLEESGAQKRAEGRLAAQSQSQNEDYNTTQEYKQDQTVTAGQRLRDVDLPLASRIFKRDTGEEQQYQTQSQAYDQTTGRQTQWQYKRAEAAGAPPGKSGADLYSILGR